MPVTANNPMAVSMVAARRAGRRRRLRLISLAISSSL
jgi:hypothetical protein